MKPRQRLEQKQTSRMYLRRKDHRDCIMNDIYHNAVWINKEQDGEQKDELAWLKYPKHALIGAVTRSNNGSISTMDVDRQFQHAYRTGNNMAEMYQLDNGITVHAVQNNNYVYRFYATQDGVIWQSLGGFGDDIGVANHFGEDSLVFYVADKPLKFRVVTFSVDEDGKIVTSRRDYNTLLNYTNPRFIGNTKDGMLFYVYEEVRQSVFVYYNNYIYHLGYNGIVEKRYEEMGSTRYLINHAWGSNVDNAYARCGIKNIFVSFNANIINLNRSDRILNFLCGASSDEGYTWTFHEFGSFTGSGTWTGKIDCCVRDGEFFVLYGSSYYDNNNVKMFASYTGTSWNEIALPSWIDLPICKTGTCVNANVEKDTFRIAVRPNETEDADITMTDLIAVRTLNRRNGNILYKDGKATSDIDEDIYFCFGGGGGWRAYFDNKYLTSSSKAFAWQIRTPSESGNVPDILYENDYCLREI